VERGPVDALEEPVGLEVREICGTQQTIV
jgi:hypothetical protein